MSTTYMELKCKKCGENFQAPRHKEYDGTVIVEGTCFCGQYNKKITPPKF